MHPSLRALADRQLGAFSAVDAQRAGYGHPEIRHLLSSGRWVRLRRGIYVTADDLTTASATPAQRHRLDCMAALLALRRPSAVVSHTSAARLWGLPVHRDAPRVVRLTDAGQWRKGNGFVVVPAPLGPDERCRSGPVPITSAARTLTDCAREWPLDDAVIAMDAALLAERTTSRELRSAASAATGWPGARRAARAAQLADGRAESPLETRGRLRIAGSGFDVPALQVEIHAGAGMLGVVDAWFDEAAVAVEFDGQVKYTAPWRGRTPERVLWDEKLREDEMRALGIRFLRVVDADLRRWPVIEERLRRLLAEPGPTQRLFRAVPRLRGVQRAA
ncbi:type IV toxin-antitoxin system AbiEi family antitoxin domain-containing protein [Petropleomorpha daqingensis]|uniref:AbiEi antitoxin N-terminal domain-containing protein n=1 Tax=Petropleomorpha daqingensis TaxID=2026353 RepID=A0A853CD80_9ACTN|nr:type IV toxin-antitoxin system AbiEi family antitoxin domain-containing protein [Petropleomorpha daqingensis]NYJ05101.1 hypothetical protein [Petropleomorpha daqingensis]